MNHITDSVRGLSLIVRLNADRFIFIAALLTALAVATWIAHP